MEAAGFFEPRERPASSDWPRFLALNLSSPLARVLKRVIQISINGATASRPTDPKSNMSWAGATSREAWSAGGPTQRGNQMPGALFQREFTSWGWRYRTGQPVLPGLQQNRAVAKDGANRHSRRAKTHVPWPGTRTTSSIPPPLRAGIDRQSDPRRRFRPGDA